MTRIADASATSDFVRLDIARDFSTTPGPRGRDEGEFSGEDFLERFLDPRYIRAKQMGKKLRITFDGAEGYATSFLEAAFGGLARRHPSEDVLAVLDLVANEDPFLVAEVTQYIHEAHP